MITRHRPYRQVPPSTSFCCECRASASSVSHHHTGEQHCNCYSWAESLPVPPVSFLGRYLQNFYLIPAELCKRSGRRSVWRLFEWQRRPPHLVLNRPSEIEDKIVSSTAKSKQVTNLKQVELWWVHTVSELAKVLGREVAQDWGKDSEYISKPDNYSSRDWNNLPTNMPHWKLSQFPRCDPR